MNRTFESKNGATVKRGALEHLAKAPVSNLILWFELDIVLVGDLLLVAIIALYTKLANFKLAMDKNAWRNWANHFEELIVERQLVRHIPRHFHRGQTAATLQ